MKPLIKWQQFKTLTSEGWVCQIGNEKIYRYKDVPSVVSFRQKGYDVSALPNLVDIILKDFTHDASRSIYKTD